MAHIFSPQATRGISRARARSQVAWAAAGLCRGAWRFCFGWLERRGDKEEMAAARAGWTLQPLSLSGPWAQVGLWRPRRSPWSSESRESVRFPQTATRCPLSSTKARLCQPRTAQTPVSAAGPHPFVLPPLDAAHSSQLMDSLFTWLTATFQEEPCLLSSAHLGYDSLAQFTFTSHRAAGHAAAGARDREVSACSSLRNSSCPHSTQGT